jgi:uncharacterized OB-fold protein
MSQTVDRTKRPLPLPTPETQHFWEGTRNGQLLIQRCDSCGDPYFPPRPFCPACGGQNVTVEETSGRGTLYSYLINHTGHPGIAGPYSIAVVQLDVGVRMMSNIVNCDQTPEALVLDMPVEVVYESFSDDITLPFFQPVGAAASGTVTS